MLIDLGLPDGTGIDLIRNVSQRKPDVDIMVVTVFGDEQHVVSSIEAGATGYILKDSTPADVISCIRLLMAGGSPVSPGGGAQRAAGDPLAHGRHYRPDLAAARQLERQTTHCRRARPKSCNCSPRE